MREKVKVQFYKITQCGFYKFGQREPEFGSLAEIFSDLAQWVVAGGKSLEETSTFTPKNADSTLRAFCFDIAHNEVTGDYFFTVWNETASNEGKVASVSGKSAVGDAEVNFTDLPEGDIPGYATYFWILPSKNVFASIRFHHSRLVGKENLSKYLKNFAACFSSFVVYEELDEKGKREIAGYRDNEDNEPKKYRPRFAAYPYRKPGQLKYIRDNVGDIYKIVSKNELSPTVPIDLTLYQKMVEKLSRIVKRQSINPDIEIRYEIPLHPTPEELSAIIEEWRPRNELHGDDVGFKMTGDGKTYWLSHALAQDNIELDVKRKDEEIVVASSILEELTQIRNKLLRLLN